MTVSGTVHKPSLSVAERKNCTLKDMMNAMLISSGLPQNMWKEAILSANYLIQRYFEKLKPKLHIRYGLEKKAFL